MKSVVISRLILENKTWDVIFFADQLPPAHLVPDTAVITIATGADSSVMCGHANPIGSLAELGWSGPGLDLNPGPWEQDLTSGSRSSRWATGGALIPSASSHVKGAWPSRVIWWPGSENGPTEQVPSFGFTAQTCTAASWENQRRLWFFCGIFL